MPLNTVTPRRICHQHVTTTKTEFIPFHTCTEQRSNLRRIHVLGNPHSSFGPQSGIFTVATVAEDTVDGLVVAHLEVASVAGLAGEIVAAVPGPANTVADFPFLFGGGDFDDCTDEFVAEAGDLAGVVSV